VLTSLIVFLVDMFLLAPIYSRYESSVVMGISLAVAAAVSAEITNGIVSAEITNGIDVGIVLGVILLLLKIFVDDALHIVIFLCAIEVDLMIVQRVQIESAT
jgi:hypothetical protein